MDLKQKIVQILQFERGLMFREFEMIQSKVYADTAHFTLLIYQFKTYLSAYSFVHRYTNFFIADILDSCDSFESINIMLYHLSCPKEVFLTKVIYTLAHDRTPVHRQGIACVEASSRLTIHPSL